MFRYKRHSTGEYPRSGSTGVGASWSPTTGMDDGDSFFVFRGMTPSTGKTLRELGLERWLGQVSQSGPVRRRHTHSHRRDVDSLADSDPCKPTPIWVASHPTPALSSASSIQANANSRSVHSGRR